VTLGIVPNRPETGYGYIRRGKMLTSLQSSENPVYQVEEFVEKPNAGIFAWRASTILAEIAAQMPSLSHKLDIIARNITDDNYSSMLGALYSEMESISIDYGVLEKSKRLAVLPADIGWSDLGDWTTIHSLSAHDERGNTLSPQVIDKDSRNSFVHGNGRTIATIGLENIVVIDTDDALLVCSQTRTQEVKQRPWGTYAGLETGEQFQVKRIIVSPGASLSLQLHHHRSEHGIVVAGVAQVINEDKEFVLQVGQSTYIPKGTKHRLTNLDVEPLEIIEVQIGTYLGEDYIVRLADVYNRI